MGELSPLTFSANIERYVVISASYFFVIVYGFEYVAADSLLLSVYSSPCPFLVLFVFVFCV
jgi:hypothetical protein